MSERHDILILQQADGAHERLLRLTEPVHRAYCARWGFAYQPVYGPVADAAGRHPFWGKVALLRQALAEGYAGVIWLDADCLIVQPEHCLRAAISSDGIGATWHGADWSQIPSTHPLYDHFNCGALYLANTPAVREFVAAWWARDEDGHPWHDQHVFHRLAQEHPLAVHPLDDAYNSTPPDHESPEPIVRAWHGAGRLEDRYAAMYQAIHGELPPEALDPGALYTRGWAAAQAGRLDEAIARFRQALARDRDEPEVMIALADACARQGNHGAAAEVLEQAVAFAPQHGDAWRQLGGAYNYLGEHAKSGRCLERALQLAPDNPLAHWNWALWLLGEGRWAEGWEEYRWGVVCGQRRLRHLQPEWDGRPIRGKTLLIWAEQGLGDSLMALRFVRHVRALYRVKILLELQAPLVALTYDCPDAQVFKQTPDGSVPFPWDEHISLLSLPRVLGITPENLPADPYLFADPEPRPAGEGFRVGVCRCGNPTHGNDANRSIPVEAFLPLREVGGVTFVTLHPEPGSGLYDFTDTAARIAACDLVVTVDTAVAHLAGAMGQPVWILLSRSCDYRWLRDRDDTPWYPSARLFRQPRLGDWESVITRVRDALRRQTG